MSSYGSNEKYVRKQTSYEINYNVAIISMANRRRKMASNGM